MLQSQIDKSTEIYKCNDIPSKVVWTNYLGNLYNSEG